MQSSRALLSLPSSSGSSLVSSRTSSNASLLRAHEYGGELESYLSLVAGERKKRIRKEGKAEKRGAAVIDWGRLLDGQCEEIQNQEEVEAEESEECGDIKQFLKPKSAPNESPEKTKKDAEGPAELSNQPPTTTVKTLPKLLSRAAAGDLTYSISMTDSFSDSSTSEPGAPIQHKDLTSNATKQLELNTRSPEPLNEAVGPHTSREDQRKTSAVTKSRRVSEGSSQSTEDDTSDLSLSQDLALSSHFRNNIFTLEQLETLDSEPDHNSTIRATGAPDEGGSATSEDIAPGDGRQFHNIVSLADLDSLPAESRAKLPEAVNVPSELVVRHRDSEQDRNSSEEQKSDDLHSTSEEIKSEDTETSVIYDEDFEDETVGRTASSHSSLDNQKSLDSVASPHSSLNRERSALSHSSLDNQKSLESVALPRPAAVEHSSPDKQGSMESIDKSLDWEKSEESEAKDSTTESGGQDFSSQWERTQSKQTTTVCGPGSRNETAPGTLGSGGVTTSQQQVLSTGAPRGRAEGPGDLHQGSGEQHIKGK